MEISEFAHALSIFFLNPALEGSDVYDLEIKAALRSASDMPDISWIYELPNGGKKLHPRSAAEWLLSTPEYEHLLPDSLREFLAAAGAVGSGPSNLGAVRRTPKKTRVIDEMKQFDPEYFGGNE